MHDVASSSHILDVIHQRRSTRSFLPDRVDESTVRALIDAAVWAPTAIHLEPWVFAVVQDRRLLRHLSDRAKALWAHPAHSSADPHIEARVPASAAFARLIADPDFNIFYDAGTLIVIGAREHGPAERFAVADCWLAAATLMLAAHEFGLGTCVIGSAVPALALPAVKADLGIPHDVTPIAPIIVGRPRTPSHITSTRKVPEIVAWKKSDV